MNAIPISINTHIGWGICAGAPAGKSRGISRSMRCILASYPGSAQVTMLFTLHRRFPGKRDKVMDHVHLVKIGLSAGIRQNERIIGFYGLLVSASGDCAEGCM